MLLIALNFQLASAADNGNGKLVFNKPDILIERTEQADCVFNPFNIDNALQPGNTP